MVDVYICCDNFMQDFGFKNTEKSPSAFNGVFDGHGRKHAADFVCSNLPRLTLLLQMRVHRTACFASGTTALAALVVGRSLLVANAGDCPAVLCRRGKAIEMSKDHKPSCNSERTCIEASGGYVDDGYLNEQLNVTQSNRGLAHGRNEGIQNAASCPNSSEASSTEEYICRRSQGASRLPG
ncbi:hypothetical protein PR202_ga15035 [Eleusine coracana subsp. coracana]|uniref:protein-serine/threonine phosphatase n=1 Tax=Eleusine coracana subsp. coracana TaxID=191504 RepID=A0AAV5CIX7_ELECO|nr:hypothetical protein PR202_ga15035 [Eleusine coracana subsp. coracana]